MSRSSTAADRRRAATLAGLAGLLALAAGPVLAQSRGERIELLEQRLAVVERQLASQALVEMAGQLAALAAGQRELRGALEELRHELDGAGQRQRDQYLDLDGRLRALEQRLAALGAEAGAATAEVRYQQALALLKERRYDEAEAALRELLAGHGDPPRAASAWYWLGEIHVLRREQPAARAAFERVVREFPDTPAAADARQALERLGSAPR